jgi:hypothetical protein
MTDTAGGGQMRKHFGNVFIIEEDITVRRTANGLGESFFGFSR